ncbi:MAG: kelch repeat-containing protein, partial [Myxococcaceae bacterium]
MRGAFLSALIGACLALGCGERAPTVSTLEAIPEVAPLVRPDVPFECGESCVTAPELSLPGALFVTASSSYDKGVLLEPAFDRGCSVRVIPQDAQSVRSRSDDGRLVFSNARSGMDALWVAHQSAAEEWLLVRDASESVRYRLELGPNARTARIVPTGSLEIRNAEGLACVRANPPFIMDSAGTERDARFEVVGDELLLSWSNAGLVPPIAVDPVWTSTASLSIPRADVAAVMLNDGRVMFSGGVDAGGPVSSTYETFDPATGTWTVSPNVMTSPRRAHTLTLLQNGDVLAAGGQNGATLATAETWSRTSDTWTATDGGMAVPRYGQNQVVLNDGTVLVLGGGDFTAVAELYDPATRRFTNTPTAMGLPRSGPAAARLQDGRVLVVGGKINSSVLTPTTEVYDPTAKTFVDGGSITSGARQFAGLTVLPSGQALMYAGLGVNGILPVAFKTAELWTPSNGAWSDAGTMNVTRFGMGGALLPNGQVLAAGGLNSGFGGAPTNTTELYDGGAVWLPAASTANMSVGHNGQGMVMLRSGRVLTGGGQVNGSNYTAVVELYDPSAPTATATQQQLSVGREYPAVTKLADGGYLVAGGFDSVSATVSNSAQVGTAGGFINTANAMSEARQYATATLLPSGKVLIAGGANGAVTSQTSELFDPATNSFGSPATMMAKRSRHTATLLADGKVLVTGGCDGSTCPAGAELYDPAANTWRAVGSLMQARQTHAAALLRNGKVVVFGGTTPGSNPYYVITELYDPQSEAFTRVGDMVGGRELPAVAMLEDGRVLAAGGYNGAILNTAEIFNPASNTWTSTASTLLNGRTSAHAILLRDGRVLIAGGANTGPVAQTELYDPTRGAFAAGPSLPTPRFRSFAVPMADGQVMIGAGNNGTASLKSVDAFDPGFGVVPAARPSPNFAASYLPGASYSVFGTKLRGVGEGTGGNFQISAPSDHPLLALSRVDNGDTVYLPTKYANTSPGSVLFDLPVGFASGHYRAVVISNGVPSLEQIIVVPPPAGAATKLQYIANVPVGNPNVCTGPFTVQLQDANGQPATRTSATTVNLTTAGGPGGVFSSNSACSIVLTAISIPAGSSSASYWYKAPNNGVLTLTASATGLTPASIDYAIGVAAQADHFDVAGFAASVPSGSSAQLTVIARKFDGTTLTNYQGTVSFSSTDTAATLPPALTFNGTEHGVLTTPTSATLRTVGVQSIKAADGIATGVHPNITVTGAAGVLSKFLVTGFPSTVTSGTSNPLTVTAQDSSGATITNFAGTVTFTSTDPAAVVPPALVFNGSEGGTKASAAATLNTAGVQKFIATSGSISSAHPDIVVTAGAPGSLTLTGFPSTVTAGTSNPLVVSVFDAAGNPVTNFAGTVTFTSTDPAAVLPPALVFNGTEGGTKSSTPATLMTAGVRTFTATTGSVSGAHANITVTSGAASRIAVTGFSAAVTAGTSNPLQVAVLDSAGNPVTNFAGTVTFTSTDPAATIPPPIVFTGSEGGSGTSAAATLRTAGTQTFTATSGSVSGAHAPITVTAGPAAALALIGFPSTTIAGVSQPFTVTARDAYGNTVDSYTGTVTFSASDARAQLPPPYTFVAQDSGTHAFSGALITAGLQSLGVGDGSSQYFQGSISVVPAPTAALAIIGVPSSVSAGAATDFTVEARDAYDNVTPSYAGTVRFLSSDAAAQLPPQTAFTSSDNGSHPFAGLLRFFTAGTQSLSVEDTNVTSLRGTQNGIVVSSVGPPVIAQDANLKGAVGVGYVYDAVGRVTATGTLPIAFDRCGGPASFSVDPVTGAVQWIPDAVGTFSVCVKATNALGSDVYPFDVVVVSRTATPVAAKLLATPTQGTVPLSVQFDATTSTADPSALPLYFSWNYGDGTPVSYAPTPVHSYALAGGYLAKLTAMDAYGTRDTATAPILVKDLAGHLPPSAKIVASALTGTDSLHVDFHCDCVPGDAPITGYLWSFGDGQTDGQPAIDHTYTPGDWSATLTVVDANGLSSTDSVELSVSQGTKTPPSCFASVSPAAGPAPLDVTWSGAARGTVASQRWVFSPSDSVDAAVVQRSYPSPTRVRGTFIATDSDGLTCQREVLLTVTGTSGEVPPLFVSLPDPHARCGVPWTYAADVAGTGPWEWSVSGAPARMSVQDGALSWTPSRAEVGSAPISLTVKGAAGSASQDFTVEV